MIWPKVLSLQEKAVRYVRNNKVNSFVLEQTLVDLVKEKGLVNS